MGNYPAIDLQLLATNESNLLELLFARLDDFQLTAVHEHAAGALRVFFSTALMRDAALAAIGSEFATRGVCAGTIEVDDENWAVRSQAELRAVQIGGIVVTPPWEQRDSSPQALTIVIEPSMGFGTGHHESTRLCLIALQTLDVARRQLLDIGTGSGVLAIAAALLGATPVVAVDVDPDALESARENAERNHVASHITFVEGDFRETDLSPADLVFANLTGAIVNQSFDRLVDLTVPGGMLIVSGFTRDELVSRRDGIAATSARVDIVNRFEEEAWRCFVLRTRHKA